ncbi:TlpA family protein disulfide reductase [Flavobacterium sp. GT2N3]|uniref:TlpA family protein disulfide reductase n=1 Tax=unclassified Flavobacterium TaxID=196869 RepID=UPI003AAEA352
MKSTYGIKRTEDKTYAGYLFARNNEIRLLYFSIHFEVSEGEIYNSETTRRKIIIFKFWFSHCQRSVQEMPNLNKLVRKNRNNVVFLSLAFDKNENLKKILIMKRFN